MREFVFVIQNETENTTHEKDQTKRIDGTNIGEDIGQPLGITEVQPRKINDCFRLEKAGCDEINELQNLVVKRKCHPGKSRIIIVACSDSFEKPGIIKQNNGNKHE